MMPASRQRAIRQKISWIMLLVLLLQAAFQPFAAPIQAAGPITGLTFTKTASVSTVNVGDTFKYTILYQADGATHVGKNVTIVDTVPHNLKLWMAGRMEAGIRKTAKPLRLMHIHCLPVLR